MTLGEAAELVAVGFDGASADDAPLDELAKLAPGAILLFGRNVGPPEAVQQLIGALRILGDLPPLIAIDQEGGRVARISAGVTPLPPAMALGALADPGLVERLAAALGRDLARLGISVDFAPVGDCAVDPANLVIGSRSFGQDATLVAALAVAFARGLERGGVAAAIKHFPGHGATAIDSHLALPRVTATWATLRERDLVPFVAAIEAAVPIVMTAHVVVEALDPELPATLSHRILTTLLRDELGFTGVTWTDCLQMDAIATGIGTVEGGVAAIAAGADLVTVSRSLPLARALAHAIVAAVENGRLERDRVDAARRRVRALRRRYARRASVVGEPALALASSVAQAAMTVVRGDVRLPPGKAVTVISFEGDAFDGAGGTRSEPPSLSAALRARRVRSELMRVALAPDPDDITLLLAHVAALGTRAFVIVVRRLRQYAAQRNAVLRLLAAVPHAITVVAAEPWDVFELPFAQTLACIYGDDALMLEACADVLCGRASAQGRLPVRADARAG